MTVICLTTSCVSHRRLPEVHGPSSANAADEYWMGRYRGVQCRENYCTLYCSRGSSSGHRLYGCTVVLLYGCAVVRLFDCTVLHGCPHTPHTVARMVARTGARTVACTVYMLERLYRNGCTVLSIRNPHTHTAKDVFLFFSWSQDLQGIFYQLIHVDIVHQHFDGKYWGKMHEHQFQ